MDIVSTRLVGFASGKNTLKFFQFQFDIKVCYPSITPELMDKALDWGDQHIKITNSDWELFEEPRSFLFHNGDVWVEIKNPEFDVAMGSFDGAEFCELGGLFLLDKIIRA